MPDVIIVQPKPAKPEIPLPEKQPEILAPEKQEENTLRKHLKLSLMIQI